LIFPIETIRDLWLNHEIFSNTFLYTLIGDNNTRGKRAHKSLLFWLKLIRENFGNRQSAKVNLITQKFLTL